MLERKTRFGCAVLALLGGCSAQAKTIYVSRNSSGAVHDGASWATAFRTVKEAITVAGSGDEVWVAVSAPAAPAYVENITLPGGVSLVGGFAGTETIRAQRNWTVNVTILEATSGRVVSIPATSAQIAVVDGFTIRKGTTSGIYVAGHASISNNTITANSSSYRGGGVYVSSGSAVISHNTITANSGSSGGGVCVDGGQAIVSNNVITGNSGYSGAAIAINAGTATIANNTISGNHANWGGGGIDAYNGTAVISGNLITGNTATLGGGGVYISGSEAQITNTTIAQNISTSDGGGIRVSSGNAVLVNTLISGNGTGVFRTAGTVSIRNSNVYGNSAFNYGGLSDPTGTNGNLSVDPMYAGVGDYHLATGSPCTDSGDDTVVKPGDMDIDGEPRIQGLHVDIGSDEAFGLPVVPPILCVSTTGDDTRDGRSWVNAKRTVTAALAAAGTGEEVWVARGTYLERVTMPSGVGLYGGFTGIETERDQRDPAANLTVLDGDLRGTVVTVPITSTETVTLDGFTIRRGTASGIWVWGSAIISNNVITACSAGEQGGGINLIDANATVIGNSITDNKANWGGGGIAVERGVVAIVRNVISGNWGNLGGGALRVMQSPANVTDNVISSNSTSYNGGAIEAWYASGTISGNTVIDNTAPLWGGGINVADSTIVISNNGIAGNKALIGGGVACTRINTQLNGNWIEGNVAQDLGGAVAGLDSTIATASNIVVMNKARLGPGYNFGNVISLCHNDTIVGNRATVPSGGFYTGGGQATIVNSILADNDLGIELTNTPSDIRHCDVFGNAQLNYKGVADQTGINGNISVDPLFYNYSPDTLDLHLTIASPCRDTGDNSVIKIGDTDIDGQPRIRGASVDIGADENQVSAIGPHAVWRVSPSGSDLNDGQTWAKAFRTIKAALLVAQSADEVWVAAGTYGEMLIVPSGISLYGGFTGSETDISQRNPYVNASTLEWAGPERVVNIWNNSNPVTVDSFTIRNGKGAFVVYQALATLSNNIISGHSVDWGGGAIDVFQGGVEILSNTFTGNSTATSGGAISVYLSTATIAGNTFERNVATSYGGAVSAGESTTSINGNTFRQNQAEWGGATAVYNGTTSVVGNTMSGNVARSGGGLNLSTSDGIVSQNTLEGNSAAWGGGLCMLGQAGVVSHNILSANKSTVAGGGLCAERCSVALTANYVSGNDSGGSGGGLYIAGAGDVSANDIIGNSAVMGGGVTMDGYASTLSSNVIARNQAQILGGGIDLASCTVTIRGNSVVANTAPDGGGIHVWLQDSLAPSMLVNNIVAGNSQGVSIVGVTPIIRHGDVFGNPAYNYSGITDPTGTNGNISIDPLFRDTTRGDYHLSAGSPCIDAGGDEYVIAGDQDHDGQKRNMGAHVDIGADESDGFPFVLTDLLSALRYTGGLGIPAAGEATRLDVAGPTGILNVSDAVLIARKLAGLAPNP